MVIGRRGERGPRGDHGQDGAPGERGPTNRLAVIGYVLLAAATAFAIFQNSRSIDQVCSTVQRQLDRNAATVQRGLDGLLLIRDAPLGARAQNVPGAAYYMGNPVELTQAISRSRRELATYQVNAC